jgi:hypothetical protein
MSSAKHRDEIIKEFPLYFCRYLQRQKLISINRPDEFQDDIDIQINISEVEEIDESHKNQKEQKESKKKEVIIDQQ